MQLNIIIVKKLHKSNGSVRICYFPPARPAFCLLHQRGLEHRQAATAEGEHYG
jgi:hypothetical protein